MYWKLYNKRAHTLHISRIYTLSHTHKHMYFSIFVESDNTLGRVVTLHRRVMYLVGSLTHASWLKIPRTACYLWTKGRNQFVYRPTCESWLLCYCVCSFRFCEIYLYISEICVEWWCYLSFTLYWSWCWYWVKILYYTELAVVGHHYTQP